MSGFFGPLGPVSGVLRPRGEHRTETGGGGKTALWGSWATPRGCFGTAGGGGGREKGGNACRAVLRAFSGPGWTTGTGEGAKRRLRGAVGRPGACLCGAGTVSAGELVSGRVPLADEELVGGGGGLGLGREVLHALPEEGGI